MVDKSRSKPKELSFSDANRKFKEHLKVATDQYLELLEKEVTDYRNVFSNKKKSFDSGEVYRTYIRLAGTAEAKKQFRNHTKRLKLAHQQRKMDQYFKQLPDALRELLPDLESIADRDWAACRDALKDHDAFPKWFIILDGNWEDNDYINTDEVFIPYSLLTAQERRAENIFLDHVNQLNAAKRKERMKEDFKHLLEKMSDVVLPGSNFHKVKLELDQSTCYKELQEEERAAIFVQHQQEIIKSAKTEFLELLLENSHLFMTFNREGNIEDHLADLQEELQHDSRYQILSELESDRYVMLLKYLAFTHSPVWDSCFMHDQEACMDKIIQQTLELKVQKTPIKDALGKWSNVNGRLQLLILGEDGLAEELASEIKTMCIEDELAFNDSVYNLEIRTVDKDIIQGYNQFSGDFSPQGCICVFTSLQSFQNIKSNLEKTSLMDNVDDDSRPLRNLPVTLMFGRDSSIPESDVLALQEEAQTLAQRINDCEIVDTVEGRFFPNKSFNDSQISKAFQFMVPLMNERARWVGSIKDPEGTVLKLRVVMMCGDPYSPDFILSPLIKENNCYRTPDVADGISVEMFIDTDRRKVDVEVLSFHQALLKHKDFTHAYILAYSAKRKASLEVLKTFLKRLARVPVVMVAVDEKMFSSNNNEYLVREGNKEADSTPNVRFLMAGANFPAQTLAYSTFLREAYNKRHETEKIHSDQHFRKLPTPPHSPLTPSGGDHVILSEDENEILYDVVQPTSHFSSSTNQPRASTSSDDSPYSLVQKPAGMPSRRVNSFHSSRGCNPYATPELPPSRLQEGWEENVAYDVSPIRGNIPPPPSTEPPQPPGPYGVVPIFKPEIAEERHYDSVAGSGSMPSPYGRPQKQKPPVKPRPRKLDPSKLQQIEQTLSHGPSHRIIAPQFSPMLRSPERDDGGGYSQPLDALIGDGRIGTGVYSQPVDALASGHNQRVRIKSSDKSSPKSTPSHPHDKQRPRKKQDKDKKKKRVDDSDKENNDKFLEELNRLIGQAADNDMTMPKSNRVDIFPTLKDSKKKKKDKKTKKPKSKPGKPKGHLRDLQIEELKFGEAGVPPFIEQCTTFIEREGLTSEGIYRMPGKTQDIDEILTNFDQNPDFPLESMDVTVNAVASSIKQFFTRLPEPILPYDMQHDLIERFNQVKESEFCKELQTSIESISPQRYEILKFMMFHLERIMQQSNENKMTADNISTCWWPSMLHPQSQSFEDLAIEAQLANIFRLFIEKTDFFFGDNVEEEELEEDGDMQALLPDQMDGSYVGEM